MCARVRVYVREFQRTRVTGESIHEQTVYRYVARTATCLLATFARLSRLRFSAARDARPTESKPPLRVYTCNLHVACHIRRDHRGRTRVKVETRAESPSDSDRPRRRTEDGEDRRRPGYIPDGTFRI